MELLHVSLHLMYSYQYLLMNMYIVLCKITANSRKFNKGLSDALGIYLNLEKLF